MRQEGESSFFEERHDFHGHEVTLRHIDALRHYMKILYNDF